MSNRFQMIFNNSRSLPQNNNFSNNFMSANRASVEKIAAPKNTPLNSPMISRIYAAKAGCGSCGKKVA